MKSRRRAHTEEAAKALIQVKKKATGIDDGSPDYGERIKDRRRMRKVYLLFDMLKQRSLNHW